MEDIKRIVITDSGATPSVETVMVPDEITHIKIGMSLDSLGIVSPDSKVIKGDKGDQGLQGVQGLKGDTGEQGPQGAKGDTGDTGLIGPQGDTGPQGIQGAKGDTGDQGVQGLPGEPPPGTATQSYAAAMALILG